MIGFSNPTRRHVLRVAWDDLKAVAYCLRKERKARRNPAACNCCGLEVWQHSIKYCQVCEYDAGACCNFGRYSLFYLENLVEALVWVALPKTQRHRAHWLARDIVEKSRRFHWRLEWAVRRTARRFKTLWG